MKNSSFLFAAVVWVAIVMTGCTKSEEQAPAPEPEPAKSKGAAVTTTSQESQARALFESYRAQMNEMKWSEADATLQKLEAMKPSLKQDLRDEIDNARAGFGAAKAMNTPPGAEGR